MQQTQVVRKQSRYSKGVIIAATRRVVKGNGVAYVQSEKDDHKFYRVTEKGCECPDFQRHKGVCKHMYACIVSEVA